MVYMIYGCLLLKESFLSLICDGQKCVFIYSFECEKLVLVGDPKQLPPTIQGSESAHDSGLEQTLFDRLCLMVCISNI